MLKQRNCIKLMGIGLIVLIVLAACGISTSPIPPTNQPANPTASPKPVQPTEAIVASLVPTEPPAPAATDTPKSATTPPAEAATPISATTQLSAQIIPTLNAYCRKGPSILYNLVTVLLKGTAYEVIGRDNQNNWWQVLGPDNLVCWVGDANVGQQGPVDQAVIVPGALLPGSPSNFVSSYTCDVATKTMNVSLNWAAAENVTGYNIYRNGVFLDWVNASQSSYFDSAPVGVELEYELEALSDNGVARRVSQTLPACR